MATIYVRTTGNDTTGNGSTGTPYATINKALSVAAAGDVILVGTGTYAENSGGGALALTWSFASAVQIWPETGTLGDVVVTNASGSYGMLVQTSAFIHWYNIVFRSSSSSILGVVRFLTGTVADHTFNRCRFEVIASSSQTNAGIVSAWTSGTFTQQRIRFVGCEFREIGPYYACGVLLDNATGGTGTIFDWQFIDCKAHVGYLPMRIKGLSRFQIVDCDLAALNSLVAGTCLQVGEDAATGADITGLISNTKCRALIGHAAVIGAGSSDVHIDRSTFYGGNNATNGQGLVIKGSTGVRVSKSTVHGGALSTLYLKAAQNTLVEDSHLFAHYSTGPTIRVGVNSEDGSKAANNVIRESYGYTNNAPLFSWDDASGDAGGNVCDQNAYTVTGAGTWGSVRGTTISSLSDLQAAWAGYDRPYNDRNSRVGMTAVRHRGNRRMKLT